jgi:HEAT repeat protein
MVRARLLRELTMKKKALMLWSGVAVATLGIVVFTPSTRYLLLGLVRHEPFQDYKPISQWIASLQDGDAEVRHEAAKALGCYGTDGKDAVPALAAALHDQDDLVRVNAALALLKIAPECQAAVPELADALQDKIHIIRMNAAIALHRMGPQSRTAVPKLIKALEDGDNWQIRTVFGQSAAKVMISTLGLIGPEAKAARGRLAELLYDERSDEATRKEIADALKKIDPDEPAKP